MKFSQYLLLIMSALLTIFCYFCMDNICKSSIPYRATSKRITSIKMDTIFNATQKISEKTEDISDPFEIIQNNMSLEEAELMNRVVISEAGNQDEFGKRLVIDTILNRCDHPDYPNTIQKVLYAKNAFSTVPYIAARYAPRQEIYILIAEELENRTNNEVLSFRTKRYHSYGIPLFKHGAHYFSTQ